MLILAIVAAVSMPVGHATNNVHTFFTNATTVGTCGTLCKGLSSTSGTGSTSTVETSLAIGSSPALDANANAVKSANWVSGTTFTVAGLSTNTATDTIIAIISNSGLVITVTGMSTPGITWDGSARTTLAPVSCAMTATEWIGHTTATLSSVTTTITLSSTPTGASAQIAAFSGSEDPSGTFNPSDKAAGFASTNSQCTGGASAPTGTSVTTLNANDMVVGFVVSSAAYTATAGTGYTLLGTATSAACGTGPGCSLGMEDQSATATAAFNCAFTAPVNRLIVICDALQSAPKYFKVEPETSASLTGTPSSAGKGCSGTGWVYNVPGIQNGLLDIQSGTWQIDLTGAVGSTTGTPVARYFVTAWSCPTNSCTTATLLWKNWDTATNVASSTTATPRTYTTASQSQITWTSGNFLAFEVWVAWQYSGTTTTTTMTETTISTAMDFITPGWDYAQSPSGSLTSASAFAKMTSILKSLSGSLSSVSSFVEKTSIFKSLAGSVTIASSLAHLDSIFRSLSASLQTASSFSEKNYIFKTLAASITFTMGSMVANVNSGQLTCNSSPHSCSTSLTATWNTASGLAEKSSLSRSLTGSMSLVSTFAEKSSVFRSLTGSLSLVASETKGHARGLSGSLGSSSGLAVKSSLFRSLTGSLSLASGFAEKGSLFRSLSGSLGVAASQVKGLATALSASLGLSSGFAEKTSLFRSLSGSLGLVASETKSLARALTGSLGLVSSFAAKSSLIRSLTGSLVWASSLAEKSSLVRSLSGSLTLGSSFGERSSLFRSLTDSLSLAGSQTKGLVKALSGTLGSASGFAEKSSLFRSLSGSLSLVSSFAEKSSLSRSLTASLSSASGFAGKNSLFRSLTGSLSLVASEAKGLAKTLSGTLGSSSGSAEKSSVFRSLTGLLGLASGFAEKNSLFRSLTGSLSLASGFAERTSLFRSLSGSWTTASSSGEKSSFFRSLAGSLSVAASEIKGLARAFSASLNSVSSFAEKSSLIRSLTGSLSTASGFTGKNSLFRSLIGSLSSASGFAEKSSLFRSLSASLTISSFEAQVSNLVHIFYYGSTSQPGCAIKCEQLVTTAGTADTTTSVKVGSSTTCCFEVVPDVISSIATATPSTSTPTGQAWVYPTDLGGITIQSGPWRFDTTIQASRTGTATMRFLVWSCQTASEGTCTLLFDFTGTANIESTTTGPIQYTDVTPTVGPFSNVHYLTVEVWLSPTGS